MSSDGSKSNVRVYVRWEEQVVFAGDEVKCTIVFKNVARVPSPPSSSQSQSQLPPLPTSHAPQKSFAQQPRHPSGERPPRQSSPLHPAAQARTKPNGAAHHGLAPPPSVRGHRSTLSLTVPSGASASASAAASTAAAAAASRSRAGSIPWSSSAAGPPPTASTGACPRVQPADCPPWFLSQRASFRPTYSTGDATTLPARPREPVPTINEHGVGPSARVLSTTSIAGTPRSSGEFYSLSNNSSETLASEYVTQQPLRTHGRQPHNRRTSSLAPGSVRLPEALMMGYAQLQGTFSLDGSLVNQGPFEQVKRKAVVGGQGGGVIGVDTSKRDSGLLRGFGWGNFTSSIGELLGSGELSSIKEMRGIASSKSIPLLSTPQSILFVDLQLRPGESKAFEYSFRLPKGLPPTHRGKAIKISYSLVIGTQRPGGAKEQQVRSVDIPFRVLGSVNSYGEILGHDLMSPYIILRDQARVQSLDKEKDSSRLDGSLQNNNNRLGPIGSSTMKSFLAYVDELLARPQESAAGLLSPSAMPTSRRASMYSSTDDGFPGGMVTTSAKDAIDLAIMRANMTGAGQQSANRFEIARNGRRVGIVMLARPAYRLGEVINMAIDFSGADIPCYAVHSALESAERVDPSLALRSDASIHRVTRKVWVTASEATLYARRIVFNPTIPVSATPEFVTSGVCLEWKIRLEFVVPTHDVERGDIEDIEEDDEDVEEDDEEENDDVDDDGDEDEDGSGEGGADDNGSEKTVQRTRHHRRHHRSNKRRLVAVAGNSGPVHPLLEEISRDDRGGLVLVAAENLTCESFEVAVPLRVYGAVCTTGLERLEKDEAQEEGLAV
ncbi:Rgp1-domain-containing protein [Lasiosphaeria miniovina]|uniref:Rgp1-domain-containing protein n=1 Tax=Lasiosphaeria miniovina TaxID=1954250 RepID=A0AA39ZZ90_9PEZI|nr:Rgp1-domain-containing protein [Lasiosphaeria miniovina]KAK0706397.1 Rgp1-domain-containing protein [Lasiosphaeria miniovina]